MNLCCVLACVAFDQMEGFLLNSGEVSGQKWSTSRATTASYYVQIQETGTDVNVCPETTIFDKRIPSSANTEITIKHKQIIL